MRKRFYVLNRLLSLPAVIVIGLLILLGNLLALIDLFPNLGPIWQRIAGTPWLASTLAWLTHGSIANWVFVLLALLLVALFEGAYRQLNGYYWPRSILGVAPRVEGASLQDRAVTLASLVVRNHQDQAITDCYVTLESATSLHGAQLTPVTTIRNLRLRWKEEEESSEDCKITLPLGPSSRVVYLADTLNGFQFSACKPSTSDQSLLGLYLVRVRVDGKVRGSDLEPQLFEGYLYVGNVRESPDLAMVFGEGNWRKDKRLPNALRKTRAG